MGLDRSPSAVVFDLDGTLIDSRDDIAAACNVALAAHGYPKLSAERIAEFVGDGARLLMARACERAPEDAIVDALLETFLDYYTDHPTTHTTLLPGARSTLAALGSLPLALCTNKPRRTTERVLENLKIGQCFELVVAGDDLPQKKPDPAPLIQIAERLGMPTRKLVMVGDGPQDIECGHAAGARTVGVRGGLLPESRLLASKPEVVLDSLHALPKLIQSWQTGALD